MRTFPYYFAASGLIGVVIVNLIEPPAQPSIGWAIFHLSCLALAPAGG